MTMQPFKNTIAQNVLLFVVFTAVFLFSCKKEPEPLTLPPATQTGENTFGCKVNGEVFVPNGNFNYPSFFEKSYNSGEQVLGILCYNTKDFDCRTSVKIAINDFDGEETYNYEKMPYWHSLFIGCINSLEGSFVVDTAAVNEVTITEFDLDSKIISGTFEYNLIQTETGEKLKITEGRFDVDDLTVY